MNRKTYLMMTIISQTSKIIAPAEQIAQPVGPAEQIAPMIWRPFAPDPADLVQPADRDDLLPVADQADQVPPPAAPLEQAAPPDQAAPHVLVQPGAPFPLPADTMWLPRPNIDLGNYIPFRGGRITYESRQRCSKCPRTHMFRGKAVCQRCLCKICNWHSMVLCQECAPDINAPDNNAPGNQ